MTTNGIMSRGARKIVVTAEAIERSKQADSSHCMIAEALKEAIPDASAVSVDLATIRYTDRKKGKRYVILTPPKAQQMLLWFDQADPRLEAFEFGLPRAAQVVAVNRAKAKKPAGERGTLPNGEPRKHSAPVRKAVVGGGSSNRVPTVVGGELPPTGPLLGGDPQIVSRVARTRPAGSEKKVRTGRARAFGLRMMAR